MRLPTKLGMRPATAAELAACLAAGAAASVLLGQDANWDLRNYHLYNPYALLGGRIGRDLLPAGMQSTFNPLLDLPYYLLATGPLSHAPRTLAALAGLPFGALLFTILRLASWMLGHPSGTGRLLPWLAAALAGSAAGTASEIGTTFNDIPVAALLIGALLVGAVMSGAVMPGAVMSGAVLAGAAQAPPAAPRAAQFAAGALLGAAAALKPTAAVFAPGLAACLLVLADGGWRIRLGLLMRLCGGGLAAAAVLAGPWALILTKLYGSPVFPLMNGLFRSEWYPPMDIVDARFRPRTLGQALSYPFLWTVRNAMLATEPPFRDARIAAAILTAPVLAAAAWRGKLAQPRRVLAVGAAAVLGLALWLPLFSILRYALLLEAFAALMIVAAVRSAALWLWPARPAAAPAAAAVLLAGLIWHTEPPDWWRVPYGKVVFDIEATRLPPDSLVVAVNAPVAMVLPFLDAPGYRAVGLTAHTLQSQHYRLFNEIERMIRSHDGPTFALTDEVARAVEAAPWFGLAVDAGTCRAIRNNITFNAGIFLCPMQRMPGADAEARASGQK